jgi:hypothetical protein
MRCVRIDIKNPKSEMTKRETSDYCLIFAGSNDVLEYAAQESQFQLIFLLGRAQTH